MNKVLYFEVLIICFILLCHVLTSVNKKYSDDNVLLSLKRLIANLINNAKRYGAEPIELSAKVENESILITVADHGEGIPADQIEELMQPFVRGDSARTIQGSGLGLAIVKRIVDIHHGEIQIHNREQGGLEVIVYLPKNA